MNEALGCHDPPIHEYTIKTEKTEEGTENPKVETDADTAVTAEEEEENVRLEGCDIADPEKHGISSFSTSYENMCEGRDLWDSFGNSQEMAYPWLRLCCTWAHKHCKPKTGQHLISKGIRLSNCS